MSASEQEPVSAAAAPQPEAEWIRRKRLAAVFGDVLPDQTSDDRSPDSSGDPGMGDEWYRDQVPPHHG